MGTHNSCFISRSDENYNPTILKNAPYLYNSGPDCTKTYAFKVLFSLFQVENLVSIELSYINTKHPDFTEAQIVHKALTEDRDGIKHLRKELQQKNMDEKENRVW